MVFGGTGSGNSFMNDTWEYIAAQLLTATPSTISIVNGGTQTFTLNAGIANANRRYRIFGWMTGTTPGVNLLGVHIPLNPDPYTNLLLGTGNSKEFTNFKGTLSATGTATASLNIPKGLQIPTGFKLYHGYVVYDTVGKIFTASNPVSVQFQ